MVTVLELAVYSKSDANINNKVILDKKVFFSDTYVSVRGCGSHVKNDGHFLLE